MWNHAAGTEGVREKVIYRDALAMKKGKEVINLLCNMCNILKQTIFMLEQRF